MTMGRATGICRCRYGFVQEYLPLTIDLRVRVNEDGPDAGEFGLTNERVARKRGPVAGGQPVAGIMSIMRAQRTGMGDKGAKVIDFILENPEEFMGMSVTDVAEAADVSESYVIKICQQLGLSGLQQLKISMS